MLNRGGQKHWRTIKSHVFTYRAVSGPPASCELHGWPHKAQLGALQHALLLQLKDRFGNSTKEEKDEESHKLTSKGAVAPTVHLSSDQLDITCEVGQCTQAADGAHQLQLSAISIRPLPAFRLQGADQPMTCDVKLSVTFRSGLCLNHDYKIDILAGKTGHLDASCVIGHPATPTTRTNSVHKLSLYGLHSSGVQYFVCVAVLLYGRNPTSYLLLNASPTAQLPDEDVCVGERTQVSMSRHSLRCLIQHSCLCRSASQAGSCVCSALFHDW